MAKVSELSGVALDWAVAKAEGFTLYNYSLLGGMQMKGGWFVSGYYKDPNHWEGLGMLKYSTDWAQGGSIIEREGISWHCGNKSSWHAYGYGSAENFSGPTPLIAAMRCYVFSKLGEEIEIPKELL